MIKNNMIHFKFTFELDLPGFQFILLLKKKFNQFEAIPFKNVMAHAVRKLINLKQFRVRMQWHMQ